MVITNQDIKRILELKKQGVTVEEIAAIYSITPRRVYQILKTQKIKKRGRPPKELDPAVVSKIITLRKEGFSISRIQKILDEEGISLSQYLVWKVIKKHLNCRSKGECRIKYEMRRRINYLSRRFHIIYLDILKARVNNERLTLLLVMDVKNCRVLELIHVPGITLNQIISKLESKYFKTLNPQSVFLVIYPIPPIAPTRTDKNKLVKFLKRKGVRYIWAEGMIGKDVSECRNRLSRKVFKHLNEEAGHKTLKELLDIGKDIIETECRRLLFEDVSGESMRLQVFDRLKMLLGGNKSSEGIKDNIEGLMRRYKFEKVLYTTSEGLPILGTFEDNDLLAARVPELLKALNRLEPSQTYTIKTADGSSMFFIVEITPEVLLFAKGARELSTNEIQWLIEDVKSQLGI